MKQKMIVTVLVMLSQIIILSAQDIVYMNGSDIPDPANKQIDTALPVGSIDGSINVSPMGATTYMIPIFAAPGTGGMIPNMTIEYNSQSGNGLLGWGWNIVGLSSIFRLGKNYYRDGKTEGVTMTSNDYFALDGNCLILQSGTYGSDGSTYKTEIETFSLITLHSTSYPGSSWLEVKFKNGTIAEYGNSQNSTIRSTTGSVLVWHITKLTDSNGNFIEYEYDDMGVHSTRESTNEVILKKILYTGNESENLIPYNESIFEYKEREDKNKTFFSSNSSNMQNLIISSIESRCEGSLVRKYEFKKLSPEFRQQV